MHPCLGQLHRMYPMGDIAWTKCRFVQPYNIIKGCESNDVMHQMSDGNGFNASCVFHKNLPMIVEIIANETDRHCIATILKIDLYEESHYYLNEILEYGFTHIIIVGRLLCGTVFLDCYGRVFKLDMMSGVLWPVGNSLAKASNKTLD